MLGMSRKCLSDDRSERRIVWSEQIVEIGGLLMMQGFECKGGNFESNALRNG